MMVVLNNSQIYYPYGCIICLKSDPNIKRCSNCKIVAYCSKNHQISDWKFSHKYLCKAITACATKFSPTINNFEEWTNYRIGRLHILENQLKRGLNSQEMLMNQFSPVCVVCFSRENLFSCSTCLNVSYCSKDHQFKDLENHNKHCDSLRLSLITDQYINLKGLPDVEFTPIDTNIISCTKDILKYVKCFDLNMGYNFLTEQQEFLALNIIKAERITLGLNLLYTLNLTKFNKENLIVHIVGASDLESESNWSVITQILSNWLNLSHITYHLIGPDLSKPSHPKKFPNYEIYFHSNLYHDILPKIPKPDLIAAFNCGLHEFEHSPGNPWASSIPKLLHYKNIPLLLTSFTKTELIRDKNLLMNLNFKLNVIRDIEKNPFAFLKPLRDWLWIDEPVFYRCNYICVIQKVD
ncbi:MYND finger [Popillia japonica]|uniref:MYND finger n=1 Tax=Popillia japonica TaxID=7064 RepID=A0AAW1KPR0_POPJA